MSKTFHNGDRRLRVRGVRQQPADLRRLARVLIEFAQAEAEAAAQSEHVTPENSTPPVDKKANTKKSANTVKPSRSKPAGKDAA